LHFFSALDCLLPVRRPLLLSISTTVATRKVGVGTAMQTYNYLRIPEESKSPAVLCRAWQHASQPAKPQLKAALAAGTPSKGWAESICY
jgi:membrane glycosyltransferase